MGKLLRLWFCFLLHSIFFLYLKLLSYIQNNFSYELARPIMGTIFLVIYVLLYGQTRLHYPARLRARVIIMDMD